MGKLLLIGGGIDKGTYIDGHFDVGTPQNHNFIEKGILRTILNVSANKLDSNIQVITTASQVPMEVGEEYKRAFELLGATNVHILHIPKREVALRQETYQTIESADVVMFTGGDQLRLTSILGGTPIHDLMVRKYQSTDFVYAGTSAGAAAGSDTMIYQGRSAEALLKGEIKITSGLGFIDNVVIDTHFVQRGRFGRLFQAVASNPKVLGIGLGEDTGLLIDGNKYTAIGTGQVVVVDGRAMADTNITQIEMGSPLSIKNLIVHIMSELDVYDVQSHDLDIYQHPVKDYEE